MAGALLLCGCGPGAQSSTGPSAFAADRHPDTVRSEGSYRVSLRQVDGSPPKSGVVRYSVVRGAHEASGNVPLEAGRDPSVWTAELPGQPPGSTIHYHFALEYPDGRRVLHPRRAPEARYRFRILPFRVSRIELPRRPASGSGPLRVALTLEAPASVSCRVRYRSGPGEFDKALPAVVSAAGPSTFEAAAELPAMPGGTVVDLYFEVSAPGGAMRALPADAPARFYTFKVGSPAVESLTGGGQVGALVLDADRLFAGLNGGGLLEIEGGAAPIRWTMADGLPSNVVRSVANDPVAGVTYIGTANGVVGLRRGVPGFEWVAGPPFHDPGKPAWQELDAKRNGSLVLVSPLDGTVLLQLERSELAGLGGGTRNDALLFSLRDGRLMPLGLDSDRGQITGLTAGRFDETSGCFLLAGVLGPTADTGERQAVIEWCGTAPRIVPIDAVPLEGDARAAPVLIEDLARHPADHDLVLAVRYAVARSGSRTEVSGLFNLRDGKVAPVSPGSEDVGAPITGLLPDRQGRRLLVSTYGRGLLAAASNGARSVPGERTAPATDLLSLAGGADGTVWLGTASGLVRLKDGRSSVAYPELFDRGVIRPDLFPLDRDREGRLLVGSAHGGFAVLERAADGRWGIRSSYAAGREIPDGRLYGDATFAPETGDIYAAALGHGLLRLSSDSTRLLTTDHGLRADRIWHVWRHPETEVLWLVYPPYPFRSGSLAGIQLYGDGTEVAFVPLEDKTLATINDLLFVPERGTVFTAGAVGVLEFHNDGRFERKSVNLAAGLARNPRTGTIVAVGTAVERWDGQRFQTVFFRADHPRRLPGKFFLRPALDVAIDDRGRWHILYPDGYLVTMDSEGRVIRLLDYEDGVPRTAQKLLHLGNARTLAVGSAAEGMVFIEAGD